MNLIAVTLVTFSIPFVIGYLAHLPNTLWIRLALLPVSLSSTLLLGLYVNVYDSLSEQLDTAQ